VTRNYGEAGALELFGRSLPSAPLRRLVRFVDLIGVETIHDHVRRLTRRLLETLDSLRHPTRARTAIVYGPRDVDRRGATVAFNFFQPDGRVVDQRYVDRVAHRHNISLRTGVILQSRRRRGRFTIARDTLAGGEFGEGMALDDSARAIGLPSGGAIRASLGINIERSRHYTLRGVHR
jgi:selenocysteine lyase/cysteine desulfurase